MQTTYNDGSLPGVGDTTPRINTARGTRRLAGESRINTQCFDQQHKADRLRENRIQNIYNRRTLFVNKLHYDPRNAPKLSRRHNHKDAPQLNLSKDAPNINMDN